MSNINSFISYIPAEPIEELRVTVSATSIVPAIPDRTQTEIGVVLSGEERAFVFICTKASTKE